MGLQRLNALPKKVVTGILSFLFTALIVCIFQVVYVSGMVIFGPTEYIRTSGMPNLYADTFSAFLGKAYLIIYNGNEDGTNRVSSATVRLNDKQVFGSNDFNQTIYVDGKYEQVEGTACRQPDGTWKPVS